MPMFKVTLQERITFEPVLVEADNEMEAEDKVFAYWYDETVRDDTDHLTCDTTSIDYDTTAIEAAQAA